MIFKMIFYGLLCLIVLICGLYAIFWVNVCLALALTVFPNFGFEAIVTIFIELIILTCIIETFIYLTNKIAKNNKPHKCLTMKYKILFILTVANIISIIVTVFFLYDIMSAENYRSTSTIAVFYVHPHIIAICFLICQTIRFMYYIIKRKIRHPIIPESRE